MRIRQSCSPCSRREACGGVPFGLTLAPVFSTRGDPLTKLSQVGIEALELLMYVRKLLICPFRHSFCPREAFFRDRRRNRPPQDGVDRDGEERVQRADGDEDELETLDQAAA